MTDCSRSVVNPTTRSERPPPVSTVVRLQPKPQTTQFTESPVERMGPCEVLVIDGPSAVVQFADGAKRSARLALAFSYEPVVGDTVLAISGPEGAWIIGVIAGSGKGMISFPGDLTVRSAGRLSLAGEEGVDIEAPKMQIRAGSLDMFARSVSQRFVALKQHVTDLLSVQAGATHTTVEGASYTHAESSTLLTKEKVTINGKAIHLG